MIAKIKEFNQVATSSTEITPFVASGIIDAGAVNVPTFRKATPPISTTATRAPAIVGAHHNSK